MGVKFLAKETTVAESPDWASNLEPYDYQADALFIYDVIFLIILSTWLYSFLFTFSAKKSVCSYKPLANATSDSTTVIARFQNIRQYCIYQ